MPSDADDPFLRAVLAAPDDDLPRLVYADWLDEHGQSERAEFIRTQVELAQLHSGDHERMHGAERPAGWQVPGGRRRYGRPNPDCRVCVLRRRERELLAAPGRGFDTNENEWLSASVGGLWIWVTRRGALGENDWKFCRGFVSEITCTAADWLAHADAVLAACPVRNARDGLVRLTTLPEAEELTVGLIGAPRGWRGPARVRPQSPYRDWQELGRPADDRAWRLALLAADWPGVRFELPAAGEFPTAVPWATTADTNPLADVRRVIGAMERTHELSTEGD